MPIKLLIVDHELAFVPIGPADTDVSGALLVRQSGLLDALTALFESEWKNANEIVVSAEAIAEITPDALDDADARILSLLLAGLNDQAVAYQLRPRSARCSGGCGTSWTSPEWRPACSSGGKPPGWAGRIPTAGSATTRGVEEARAH